LTAAVAPLSGVWGGVGSSKYLVAFDGPPWRFTMSEWEYAKINLNELPRRTSDIDLLNDYGGQGWEQVCVTVNSIAYLKHRIVEAPVPKAPQRRRTAASRTTV
jgi:hypothetical protein